MPCRIISVARAKATLSDAIREVEAGGTIVITRYGRPVAALVRAEDLRAIERLGSAGPETGLVSVAGGWEGSEEIVEAIEAMPWRGCRRVPTLQ